MQQLLAQDARHYSTFRLPANLARVTEVESLEMLQAYQPSTPPLILGEGSNSIFLTDWQGDILRYVAANVIWQPEDDVLLLHAEAGCNWHQLVQSTVSEGWWGLENLALIPGSVGAAPVQNIGAYGVELADCCIYVDFFDWHSRKVQRFTSEQCNFGYRDSVFKTSLSGQGVIVAVGLKLQRKSQPHLSYKGLDHLPPDCSPAEVMEAVIAIRQSKLPDPSVLANCGSFFKNPILSFSQFKHLLNEYPSVPNYPQPNQNYKVAAAWLIEQVGLKGYRHGEVGCYPLQPLVLVNYGGGTAEQLREMIALIQQSVLKKFAIMLEPEVRLLNQHD